MKLYIVYGKIADKRIIERDPLGNINIFIDRK